MTPLALVLVFSAAVFHVAWNYLTKSSPHKKAFLWLINIVFSVVFLPVFFLMGFSLSLPWWGWGFVVFSGLGHALYYWALSRAYDAGDLSLVYPLSRGSSVFFVAVLSVPVLGEHLSPLGGAGIGAVLLGILTLHIQSGSWRQSLLPSRTPGSMWALLTGLIITGFSLIDKAGVGMVDPVPYVYLIFLIAGIFFTPFALRDGWGPVKATWRTETGGVIACALLVLPSYLFILFAFTLSPAAYVVASREVRLVLGTLVGAFFLREGHKGYRLAGAALIVLGVALLAFAK
jgi:drug/metabolite transporter (DMT)-like permease